MSTVEQPTTAAGRQLLAALAPHKPYSLARNAHLGAILAIEAEARQQDASALREIEWPRVEPGTPCSECGAVLHGYPCIHHKEDCPLLAALPPSASPAQDARLGVLVEVAIRSTDTDLRDAARAVLPVDAWFARLEQDQ